MIDRDRHRGCLLGLAAGDALGTTVEFRRRGTFEPLTRIVGGGPFRLRLAAWLTILARRDEIAALADRLAHGPHP
jgi:hypothetical protein